MTKFYSADRPDKEYLTAMHLAYEKYHSGVKPSYSTGICESITAGYGRLDEYGYWEFPLNVIKDPDGTITILEES